MADRKSPEDQAGKMGRKRSERVAVSVKIYKDALTSIKILSGYTGEEDVACLSRIVLECANKEILKHQAEWQRKQAKSEDQGPGDPGP